MGTDFKARIRAKFSRRNSTVPSLESVSSEQRHTAADVTLGTRPSTTTEPQSRPQSLDPAPVPERNPDLELHRITTPRRGDDCDRSFSMTGDSQTTQTSQTSDADLSASTPRTEPINPMSSSFSSDWRQTSDSNCSSDLRNSAANLPSINELQAFRLSESSGPNSTSADNAQHIESRTADDLDLDPLDTTGPSINLSTPPGTAPLQLNSLPSIAQPASTSTLNTPRRQSLLPSRQITLIRTLLQAAQTNDQDPNSVENLLPIQGNMVTRKVWVKRPGASATLITVNEDDLVDDIRDLILRKYGNSLGRQFDSPDLTLRVIPREPQRQERSLGPEEPVGRTLDAYYPGGQSVDEALVIDIPSRRTPRASPRSGPPHHTAVYFTEDGRPSEAGEGYFPPVPSIPSPHLPVVVPATVGIPSHSIAVLGTGQIPPIPSPGGTRSRAYRERPERPRLGRTHTSSPTILSNAQVASIGATVNHGTQPFVPRLPRSRAHSNASDQPAPPPAAPPLPTPPISEVVQVQRVATPPPRVASPRPAATRPKKKKNLEHPTLPPGMLNGTIPPINVLMVEDNPINLKLLEAFVKRLKVRWETAMNGRDAVTKWRSGGFHLVLMDIQLPVMNGLDATREIRRLERVNSIGVFSSSASSVPEASNGEVDEKDKLANLDLFKSPVIIVALTASSLQSDRQEALAAGCNDFLTKVNNKADGSILLPTSPPSF
jgi:osomolarity two-component system, response regulator SSK1